MLGMFGSPERERPILTRDLFIPYLILLYVTSAFREGALYTYLLPKHRKRCFKLIAFSYRSTEIAVLPAGSKQTTALQRELRYKNLKLFSVHSGGLTRPSQASKDQSLTVRQPSRGAHARQIPPRTQLGPTQLRQPGYLFIWTHVPSAPRH